MVTCSKNGITKSKISYIVTVSLEFHHTSNDTKPTSFVKVSKYTEWVSYSKQKMGASSTWTRHEGNWKQVGV